MQWNIEKHWKKKEKREWRKQNLSLTVGMKYAFEIFWQWSEIFLIACTAITMYDCIKRNGMISRRIEKMFYSQKKNKNKIKEKKCSSIKGKWENCIIAINKVKCAHLFISMRTQSKKDQDVPNVYLCVHYFLALAFFFCGRIFFLSDWFLGRIISLKFVL